MKATPLPLPQGITGRPQAPCSAAEGDQAVFNRGSRPQPHIQYLNSGSFEICFDLFRIFSLSSISYNASMGYPVGHYRLNCKVLQDVLGYSRVLQSSLVVQLGFNVLEVSIIFKKLLNFLENQPLYS